MNICESDIFIYHDCALKGSSILIKNHKHVRDRINILIHGSHFFFEEEKNECYRDPTRIFNCL